jgi:hypothetical protein
VYCGMMLDNFLSSVKGLSVLVVLDHYTIGDVCAYSLKRRCPRSPLNERVMCPKRDQPRRKCGIV